MSHIVEAAALASTGAARRSPRWISSHASAL
jgi:hypothetical protein